MGKGDTLTLVITVSGSESANSGEPQLPNLNDFELLNKWTSMESRASMVTNDQGQQEFQTTRMQKFNYVLSPKRTGELQIAGIRVTVGDQTMTTAPLKIAVSETSPRGQDPNQRRQQARRGLPRADGAEMLRRTMRFGGSFIVIAFQDLVRAGLSGAEQLVVAVAGFLAPHGIGQLRKYAFEFGFFARSYSQCCYQAYRAHLALLVRAFGPRQRCRAPFMLSGRNRGCHPRQCPGDRPVRWPGVVRRSLP